MPIYKDNTELCAAVTFTKENNVHVVQISFLCLISFSFSDFVAKRHATILVFVTALPMHFVLSTGYTGDVTLKCYSNNSLLKSPGLEKQVVNACRLHPLLCSAIHLLASQENETYFTPGIYKRTHRRVKSAAAEV